MIQTEKERKLQELEEIIQEKRRSDNDGCLYKPEPCENADAERFGFPPELFSIME